MLSRTPNRANAPAISSTHRGDDEHEANSWRVTPNMPSFTMCRAIAMWM